MYLILLLQTAHKSVLRHLENTLESLLKSRLTCTELQNKQKDPFHNGQKFHTRLHWIDQSVLFFTQIYQLCCYIAKGWCEASLKIYLSHPHSNIFFLYSEVFLLGFISGMLQVFKRTFFFLLLCCFCNVPCVPWPRQQTYSSSLPKLNCTQKHAESGLLGTGIDNATPSFLSLNTLPRCISGHRWDHIHFHLTSMTLVCIK